MPNSRVFSKDPHQNLHLVKEQYDIFLKDGIGIQDIHTFPAGVTADEVMYFAVPSIDVNCYINNETVLVKFIHTVNGNTNHHTHINFIGIEV